MIIDIYRKEIISFTCHLTRRNNLTVNHRVWLKGIWRQRNFDHIVTMTQIIISINSTTFTFHNDQILIHHINIKNNFIYVSIILFLCFIINIIHYNPVIATTNNLRLIEIIYSTISRLINYLFEFWILGNI